MANDPAPADGLRALAAQLARAADALALPAGYVVVVVPDDDAPTTAPAFPDAAAAAAFLRQGGDLLERLGAVLQALFIIHAGAVPGEADDIGEAGVRRRLTLRAGMLPPAGHAPRPPDPTSDGRFVLILGERRCRASRLAGKITIPAIVRRVSDQQAAEMTVVENLQRQDLNCLEQAAAFAKLSRDFGMTQQQIGDRVGLSRESISNYMRLLKLPGTVLEYLRYNKLSFGQAREMLALENAELITRVADEAVKKNLTDLQVEDLVAKLNGWR